MKFQQQKSPLLGVEKIISQTLQQFCSRAPFPSSCSSIFCTSSHKAPGYDSIRQDMNCLLRNIFQKQNFLTPVNTYVSCSTTRIPKNHRMASGHPTRPCISCTAPHRPPPHVEHHFNSSFCLGKTVNKLFCNSLDEPKVTFCIPQMLAIQPPCFLSPPCSLSLT